MPRQSCRGQGRSVKPLLVTSPVGSTPTFGTHENLQISKETLGRISQNIVRKLRVVGSVVEHLPFKQAQEGPIPSRLTMTKNVNVIILVSLVTGKSKSESKRLFNQKAIDINGKTATTINIEVKDGDILKIGKFKFFRLAV